MSSSLGVTLAREDLERWAGRVLTDAEITRIRNRVADSTIPDAIRAIVNQLNDSDDHGTIAAEEETAAPTDESRCGNCVRCQALVHWTPSWHAYLDDSNDPFCPNGDHHALAP